jgi:hypothetical protein
MPRGSVRNIPNLRKGHDHLNQFEFQKRHGEMTAEAEMPFGAQTYKSEQTQPKEAAQTPGQLHELYDPRKRGVVKMERQKTASTKRPVKTTAKKAAGKSAKSKKSTR